MSKTAKWMPLSVDWMDSEMFDDSTPGERLAWICLLCHIKSTGRAGKAKVRAKVFANRYNLSERSVSDMLKSARENGAVKIDGNVVILCNWKVYNDRARERNLGQNGHFTETPENPETALPLTTTHKPQNTNHKSQKKNPPNPPRGNDCVLTYPPELNNKKFKAAWVEWIEYRKQAKLKRYTPMGAKKQFTHLANELGSDRAVAAIGNSIRQGFQGIYESNKNRSTPNTPDNISRIPAKKGKYDDIENSPNYHKAPATETYDGKGW